MQNYNKIFLGYHHVNWLRGGKTNVLRTIFVLVFRVLIYLENQSVSYIGLSKFHVHDSVFQIMAWEQDMVHGPRFTWIDCTTLVTNL
jgi:hypothetical protein